MHAYMHATFARARARARTRRRTGARTHGHTQRRMHARTHVRLLTKSRPRYTCMHNHPRSLARCELQKLTITGIEARQLQIQISYFEGISDLWLFEICGQQAPRKFRKTRFRLSKAGIWFSEIYGANSWPQISNNHKSQIITYLKYLQNMKSGIWSWRALIPVLAFQGNQNVNFLGQMP